MRRRRRPVDAAEDVREPRDAVPTRHHDRASRRPTWLRGSRSLTRLRAGARLPAGRRHRRYRARPSPSARRRQMDAWIPEDASWIERAAKSVWKGSTHRQQRRSRARRSSSRPAPTRPAVGGIQKLLDSRRLSDHSCARHARRSPTSATTRPAPCGSRCPIPAAQPPAALGFAALVQAATGKPLDRRTGLRQPHRPRPDHDQDRAPGRRGRQRRRGGTRRARPDARSARPTSS